MKLRRREETIAVAVGSAEEACRHSATAGVRIERSDDLIQFKAAVVVAIEHVSGHLWNPAVHVSSDVLVRDEASSVGKNAASFNVVPVAVAVDDISNGDVEPLCELLL